jgi:hypothetical protein
LFPFMGLHPLLKQNWKNVTADPEQSPPKSVLNLVPS